MGKIVSIAAKKDYVLGIDFVSGSHLDVDLSGKLHTAKYSELSDPHVFCQVAVEGDEILWGKNILRVSLKELIDVALCGQGGETQ